MSSKMKYDMAQQMANIHFSWNKNEYSILSIRKQYSYICDGERATV